MPTLTVRDLDAAVLERLKAAARAHNRSLAGEVREALAAYVAADVQDAVRTQRAAWLEEVRAIAARSRPGTGLSGIMDEARGDWDAENRHS